jgi:hypothetical protein
VIKVARHAWTFRQRMRRLDDKKAAAGSPMIAFKLGD